MTDDPHKSQAAWQDVEQVLQQESNLHVLKILIADAKAADAARIAALEQQLAALPTTAAWQDVRDRLGYIAVHHGLEKAEAEIWAAIECARAADAQQIAALQDAIEQVQMSAEIADANAVAARRGLQDAEQQIAALRAENEQAGHTMAASLALANQIIQELRDKNQIAEAQLTALQAERYELRDLLAQRSRNSSMPWLQKLNEMEGRALAAEAQVASLQAEQAQWQQKEKP